jgi:glycosyltransferase involved in cell wall biosynthesis
MGRLFEEADSFAFPYRQIDASGVYFLVKSLGKWLIASRVGVFAEDMEDGDDGALVPVGDAKVLADALRHAVLERPAGNATTAADSWTGIGHATHKLYREAMHEHAGVDPRRAQGWAR